MMKKKSPIKKISHAARQGAQFATVAAHRGSQFIDQASSVVQNGTKLSSVVVGSATSSGTGRPSLGSYAGDQSRGSAENDRSTSSASASPPFISLKDRINKFDSAVSAATSRHAGNNSSKIDSKLLSPTIGTRRKLRNKMKNTNSVDNVLVETVDSMEDDNVDAFSSPPFNPNFNKTEFSNAEEQKFEKENETPNYYQQFHQTSPQKSTTQSTSSHHATRVNKDDNRGTTKYSPQSLASFTAAIRKTTPRKPVKNKHESESSSSKTASTTSHNDNAKTKEEILEERLRALEKENKKLLKKNASLEKTCDELISENRILEAAASNNETNSHKNASDSSANSFQCPSSSIQQIMRKRNNELHPLMSSPLRKHVKAVHDASESNSVVTIRKEPFQLMPPEQTASIARSNGINTTCDGVDYSRNTRSPLEGFCHLDTLGTLTGNKRDNATKSTGGGSSCVRKSKSPAEEEEEKKKTKEVDDALDLLNSAAFLFAGSSRRKM